MRMIAETHMPAPDATMLRDILNRMRHDGCGGRAGRVEFAHRHRGRFPPAGAQDRAATLLIAAENTTVTIVPELTRMIARVEDWIERLARRTSYSTKSATCYEMRRELLGSGRQR